MISLKVENFVFRLRLLFLGTAINMNFQVQPYSDIHILKYALYYARFHLLRGGETLVSMSNF